MKRIVMVVVASMLLSTTAFGSEKVDVFVSIAPIKWLVDKIGQEKINSHILVAAGQEPHTFEPTPKQIATLSKSEFWFTSSLEFEKQLHAKIANISKSLKIIDITTNIDKLPMAAGHQHEEHEHEAEHAHSSGNTAEEHPHEPGHEEKHHHDDDHHEKHGQHDEHGDYDPHVWLSPLNLKIMADVIVQALTAADSEAGDFYQRNAQALHRELDAAHARISATLKPYAGSSFYVYHPSFAYFADTYDLQQRAVELEGKAPTPKQLKRMIAQAREQKMQIIFVQPQFDPKSANAVAQAIGGNVVPLDPLHGEVIENLMKMAEKISSALDKP